MRNDDLQGADWTASDALDLELAHLIEEADRRRIRHRLDLAAIAVALVLLGLSVYVIAWG